MEKPGFVGVDTQLDCIGGKKLDRFSNPGLGRNYDRDSRGISCVWSGKQPYKQNQHVNYVIIWSGRSEIFPAFYGCKHIMLKFHEICYIK